MINKSQYYKVIRLPIFLEAPRWRVLSPDARTSNAGTPPGSYNLIVRGTLKSGTAVLVHKVGLTLAVKHVSDCQVSVANREARRSGGFRNPPDPPRVK